MGASFVRFGGHGFWSRDGFVEDWLQQLIGEIDGLSTRPEWLVRARDHWHLQSTAGFNGCVDCSFDELLSEQSRRDLVLELALRVLERASMTRGESTAADLFVRLLRGEIRTTVTSPKDYLARD